jgi:hypothetical protein
LSVSGFSILGRSAIPGQLLADVEHLPGEAPTFVSDNDCGAMIR